MLEALSCAHVMYLYIWNASTTHSCMIVHHPDMPGRCAVQASDVALLLPCPCRPLTLPCCCHAPAGQGYWAPIMGSAYYRPISQFSKVGGGRAAAHHATLHRTTPAPCILAHADMPHCQWHHLHSIYAPAV
jgi:hypothetical protein